MRKTRFKMMLVAAFAAFALLLAGFSPIQAQTDSNDPFASLPSGNFVNQGDAVVILANHVSYLKGVLVTLTPGTSSYLAMERAAVYYDILQVEVADGKAIPNSIVSGLGFVREYRSDYALTAFGANSGPSIIELIGLREDAIELLSL
jgi:hypothetical protein